MFKHKFVPKVDKLEFYSYESIGGTVVQLVGESNETFVPSHLSTLQISRIIKRAKLCELLISIEFRIDSYGLINYYRDSKHGELVNFEYLKHLLEEYDDIEGINYIQKSLEFFKKYEKELEKLNSAGEHFEMEYDKLNSLIDFENNLNSSLWKLDKEIRTKPDDFCFDENGNSIDPNFSGNLKKFFNDGKLAKDYNFENGRLHGEALEYNVGGEDHQIKLFENGQLKNILKRFDYK